MRCIFCKNDSTTSKSVEHIIPESLWNKNQILPATIVCDKCNNYFSRKVEKPFLCSPEITALRFNQSIPSKKRKIPAIAGILAGSEHPVKVIRDFNDGDIKTYIEVTKEQFNLLQHDKSSTLMLPTGLGHPEGKTSRFLAKVAIEALAQRLLNNLPHIEGMIDDDQLDPLRNHARYGQPEKWDYYVRRIYDPNLSEDHQVVHEYDFLFTQYDEVYFVLALYGLEMTINVAGPHVDGYKEWLAENLFKSPLYPEKSLAELRPIN